MSDLIEQLRDHDYCGIAVERKAADEIERLTAELDNERARGIHSCGPHCQQIECKQGRRIAKLEAIESAAIKCVHEDDSYNNTNELAEALKEAK